MSTPATPRRSFAWLGVLALLLIAPGLMLARLASLGDARWLAIGLASLALFTFMLYAADKSRATANDWRIPEWVLHLVALLGGWPGAFAAQHLLRHKTAKRGFQAVFWLIVVLHQLLAIDYLTGWPLLRRLLDALGFNR